MYDALKVLSSSLRDFSANEDINVEELDCSSPSKWSQGESILKILDEVISKQIGDLRIWCQTFQNVLFALQKSVSGITNQITFNDIFERNYFVLEVIEFSAADVIEKIAIWNPDDKVQNLRTAEEVYAKISQSLQNRTLIVTSRIGLPHLAYK